MATEDYNCDPESIVALIEGDLEPDARLRLEQHLAGCKSCTSELQSQQQFMCELESVLSGSSELPVPKNFARVVAVRAESDMRGLREKTEHKTALRLCILLAVAAFALLGATSTRAIFVSAQSILNKTLALLGLVGRAAYDATTSLAVIVRVIGAGAIGDSRYAGLTALLLVAFAVGLLTLLISRYHRARLSE
jgi:Putative zinc-finger